MSPALKTRALRVYALYKWEIYVWEQYQREVRYVRARTHALVQGKDLPSVLYRILQKRRVEALSSVSLRGRVNNYKQARVEFNSLTRGFSIAYPVK